VRATIYGMWCTLVCAWLWWANATYAKPFSHYLGLGGPTRHTGASLGGGGGAHFGHGHTFHK
jgi:hypothetical protein